MPSVPAVERIVLGDELVGDFGDRLQPAREPALRSAMPPIIKSEITATAMNM